MPASFQLRNLTVEEVFDEFRMACNSQDLIPNSEIHRIDMATSLIELATLCGDSDDLEDFLVWFEYHFSLPDRWAQTWDATHSVCDICADVAGRIEVPVSESVTILGRPCETAGMYRMMKQLLMEAGGNTGGMAPSSPIRTYLRHYSKVFARVRLARRGRLPALHTNPVGIGCVCCVATGVVLGVTALVLSSGSWLAAWSILLLSILTGAVVERLTTHGEERDAVHFPGIVTFRDFIHAAFDRPATKPTSAFTSQ